MISGFRKRTSSSYLIWCQTCRKSHQNTYQLPGLSVLSKKPPNLNETFLTMEQELTTPSRRRKHLTRQRCRVLNFFSRHRPERLYGRHPWNPQHTKRHTPKRMSYCHITKMCISFIANGTSLSLRM